MKKLIMLFVLVFASIFVYTSAFAAWEITVSWKASTGPDLAYEELVVGSTVIHTVQAGGQTAHIFSMQSLSGESVKIVSYNKQGVSNAGYIIGKLEAISPPADASGGSIIIQWKP